MPSNAIQALLGLIALGLSGCISADDPSAPDCVHTASCASRLFDATYGPIHAQAVAPDAPWPRRPMQ